MNSKYALATAVFLFFVYLASKGELLSFFQLMQPKTQGKTTNRTGRASSSTNTLAIPNDSSIKPAGIYEQAKEWVFRDMDSYIKSWGGSK